MDMHDKRWEEQRRRLLRAAGSLTRKLEGREFNAFRHLTNQDLRNEVAKLRRRAHEGGK